MRLPRRKTELQHHDFGNVVSSARLDVSITPTCLQRSNSRLITTECSHKTVRSTGMSESHPFRVYRALLFPFVHMPYGMYSVVTCLC